MAANTLSKIELHESDAYIKNNSPTTNGNPMKRKFPFPVLMLVFSLIGLTRFTENVRDVQILGLFACGAVFGVGLSMLILVLRKTS